MPTKTQPALVARNGASDLSIRFYISDPASGSAPRVEVSLLGAGISVDHAVSEYSTLTPANKTSLRTLLTAIRDETFTLEGFV